MRTRGVDTAELALALERYRTDKLHLLQTRGPETKELVLSARELERFVSKTRELLSYYEDRLRLIYRVIGLPAPLSSGGHVLRFTGGLGVTFFCGDYLQGADTLENLNAPLELKCPLCKKTVTFRFEPYEVTR